VKAFNVSAVVVSHFTPLFATFSFSVHERAVAHYTQSAHLSFRSAQYLGEAVARSANMSTTLGYVIFWVYKHLN